MSWHNCDHIFWGQPCYYKIACFPYWAMLLATYSYLHNWPQLCVFCMLSPHTTSSFYFEVCLSVVLQTSAFYDLTCMYMAILVYICFNFMSLPDRRKKMDWNWKRKEMSLSPLYHFIGQALPSKLWNLNRHYDYTIIKWINLKFQAMNATWCVTALCSIYSLPCPHCNPITAQATDQIAECLLTPTVSLWWFVGWYRSHTTQ